MLTVTHRTEYVYNTPVLLHDHRLMVRPRDSHDLWLMSASLKTTPAPRQTRWFHDVFSNSVARLSFDVETDRLEIVSTLVVETYESVIEAPQIAEHARRYPFSYTVDERRDLGALCERQYDDPDPRMGEWLRDTYASLLAGSPTIDTLELLSGFNQRIGTDFGYQRREAEGTQTPAETVKLGGGSCRDFALLFMEAARHLGFAARFVSGYLVDIEVASGRAGTTPRGGGATHAWAQIYVPGLGWIEFDPTNEIVGSGGLIRVAVTRDPTQAIPIAGTFTGPTGALVALNVDVSMQAGAPPTMQASPPPLVAVG